MYSCAMPYGRPLFAPCSVECIGWSEERVAIISPMRAQQGEDCRYFRPAQRVTYARPWYAVSDASRSVYSLQSATNKLFLPQ